MRKIGIGSNAYLNGWDNDFEKMFEKMASHGFQAVDVDLSSTDNNVRNLYQQGDAVFESTLKQVKAAAEHSGIEIYQTHGPWRCPPKDDTEENRAEWRSYMERGMRGNAILGCKHFVIHPIMPFGADSNPDSKMFFDLNYDFYTKLIPVAEKLGVIICIENMPFPAHSIARPNEIADFVKALNSDNVAMCLDTGHAMILGWDPGDSVVAMKDKLVTFHIHDNDSRGDRHECPFFGVGNWTKFRDALREHVSPDVPVILETRPGKDVSIPTEIRDTLLPGFAAVARWLANS